MSTKITKAIVTGLYVGLIPFAPGTMGSLFAFPLCLGLLGISAKLKLKISIAGLEVIHQELLAIGCLLLIICALLFIVGTYLSDIYVKENGEEDPKEVVIDEIAGQMLTILPSSFACIFAHNSYLTEKFSKNELDFIFLFILPFGFFRLFDILKPRPIDWCDKNIKGGFGIMFDDFLAAIFASVMCYAVTFVIIGN